MIYSHDTRWLVVAGSHYVHIRCLAPPLKDDAILIHRHLRDDIKNPRLSRPHIWHGTACPSAWTAIRFVLGAHKFRPVSFKSQPIVLQALDRLVQRRYVGIVATGQGPHVSGHWGDPRTARTSSSARYAARPPSCQHASCHVLTALCLLCDWQVSGPEHRIRSAVGAPTYPGDV